MIEIEAGDLEISDTLNRATFEEQCNPLLKRIDRVIEKALQTASLRVNDISEVVLVGGSSRIPKIKENLSKMFGKEPNMDMDPDLAIAKGASIHAANLLKSGGELEYADVTTHNIGIEVAGGKMFPILKKGTPMNGGGKEEGFKTVDKD